MKSMKMITNIILTIIIIGLAGCQKDWLEENPLSALSDASFWKTENDATLALVGVYQLGVGNGVDNLWQTRFSIYATDDARCKFEGTYNIGDFQKPADADVIRPTWRNAYAAIYRANVFLTNIERVDMDATKKAEFIAEVKFIRANQYFWLLLTYGGVPLVTKVLSIPEANSQTRNSRNEIVDFCLTEFSASATDLPASRPANQKGRILKSAALAQKGRLLMIEHRWSEAASAFKEIMDLNVHIIDPRYKKLFEKDGETSKEIIYSVNYIETLSGNPIVQKRWHVAFFGGYQEYNAFQDLIDAFLMNDGLPIEESPLYDPANPFVNRDPRLYASMFLPEYTVFNGKLYLAHPNLTNFGIKELTGATGYGCKKYVTENFTGNRNSSEDDLVLIRYAEVLLGYLESKLEAGDAIDQVLLDQTINKVRGRAEVKMPSVTETDRDKLREIVRRERRVEFCWEPNMRWMDIHRWGIASQVIKKKFYGMKLTDDPANYTAYPVNEEGHLFSIDKTSLYVSPKHDLWPIPLTELDINPNLGQNPGY